MLAASLLLSFELTAPPLPPVPEGSCTSELDCELSGACVGGKCRCDPGWRGPTCTLLDLIPNRPGHFAYRALAPAGGKEKYWGTWGASQPIRDSNGAYHLFSTRILNNCPLNDYTYNEDLIHATSKSLLGPYSFQNVALNTTIINPHVVRAPDGEYVLFYSGEPLPAHFHKNCSSSAVGTRLRARGGVGEPPGPPGYVNIGCVLSIARTDSLDKPFEVQRANFTPAGAEHLFCRTNPTAYIFTNGTTLLYFRSAGTHGENEQIWLARAPHYLGPYELYTPNTEVVPRPIFPVHNEDPFIFRNARGRFLLMLHQSHWGPGWNGAKAWSYDGLDWRYSQGSMTRVWSSEMNYTDGTSVTFRRREEPKIYTTEDGEILAMFNAVSDSTGTYVMSQGIGRGDAF